MYRWIPLSMVRISIIFVAGILLGIYYPNEILLQYLLIVSVFFILLYLFFTLVFFSRSIRFFVSIIAQLSFFCLGYIHVLIKTESRQANHLLNSTNPIKCYEAVIRSIPEKKAKTWKIEIEIHKIKTSSWQNCTGNVIVYIQKTSSQINWKYGDRIWVAGEPIQIKPPANNGEFDYKQYYSFKNIYHQQFLLPHQVVRIGEAKRKGFIYYSHRAREWASDQLTHYVAGAPQQAIASALILGVTSSIDNELRNAYAASGAMHVLAVSGLHVGIIYALLVFLMRPLQRFLKSPWWESAICLLLLWGFAFLTGLSPSVLRAVTMFSFVLLAKPFAHRTNTYNTLVASAFILLLYDPFLIMSVGFQLSYLAVLGIVYLYKKIYHVWEPDTWIGDWVWKITCVSISAQVSVFALTLYYFHQFPIYFLLANILIIPLSNLVLIVGVSLLGCSFISPLAWLVGKLLTILIYLLNNVVFITERMPYSLINHIHLTAMQCWLLIGLLCSVILLFEFRKMSWVYVSLICVITFSIIQWNHYFQDVLKSQLVVYSIRNHSAIEIIQNGRSTFYFDSVLLKHPERVRFHILPNRIIHGVVDSKPMYFKYSLPLFYWQKKLVAIANHRFSNWPPHFKVDILIVSNNSFPISMLRSSSYFVDTIIVDGSNAPNYSNALITEAKIHKIETHAVIEKGSWTLTVD